MEEMFEAAFSMQSVPAQEHLHGKTEPSLVEEEAPFRNTCMSRRE
jgi:hypothetical protein